MLLERGPDQGLSVELLDWLYDIFERKGDSRFAENLFRDIRHNTRRASSNGLSSRATLHTHIAVSTTMLTTWEGHALTVNEGDMLTAELNAEEKKVYSRDNYYAKRNQLDLEYSKIMLPPNVTGWRSHSEEAENTSTMAWQWLLHLHEHSGHKPQVNDSWCSILLPSHQLVSRKAAHTEEYYFVLATGSYGAWAWQVTPRFSVFADHTFYYLQAVGKPLVPVFVLHHTEWFVVPATPASPARMGKLCESAGCYGIGLVKQGEAVPLIRWAFENRSGTQKLTIKHIEDLLRGMEVAVPKGNKLAKMLALLGAVFPDHDDETLLAIAVQAIQPAETRKEKLHDMIKKHPEMALGVEAMLAVDPGAMADFRDESRAVREVYMNEVEKIDVTEDGNDPDEEELLDGEGRCRKCRLGVCRLSQLYRVRGQQSARPLAGRSSQTARSSTTFLPSPGAVSAGDLVPVPEVSSVAPVPVPELSSVAPVAVPVTLGDARGMAYWLHSVTSQYL